MTALPAFDGVDIIARTTQCQGYNVTDLVTRLVMKEWVLLMDYYKAVDAQGNYRTGNLMTKIKLV